MQRVSQVKCTVLGAGGFIGGHLVRDLIARGNEVWAPKRGDRDILTRPLGHVFYCVGLTADFRSRPFDTVDAHVSLLSEVLCHAEFEGLLYLSSTRVYARCDSAQEDQPISVAPTDPSDLYNISKLMGESLCLASGRAGVKIARLSNVLGSGMTTNNFVVALLREARTGELRLRSHPDSVKDYVLVDDVTQLLCLIARGGVHAVYNVASGTQIAHSQWLSLLQHRLGCSVWTDTTLPMQSFPSISTERIRSEFNFELGDVLEISSQHINTW